MKLTLIRHGLTEGNVRHLYYGSTDLPLLPEGIEQLKTLSVAGSYPAAAKFYTSPLRRTQETLQHLYGNVPFTVIPELREMPFGIFEMKRYEDIKDEPLFRGWCGSDWRSYVGPGGESWLMVAERAVKALSPIMAGSDDAVCVTHGGVISSVMTLWFSEQIESSYAITPPPGHGYTISVEHGAPVDFHAVP